MNSLIFLLFPLVLVLNGLWYWVKSILKNNGYEASNWIHFTDIPNIFRLATKTKDGGLKTRYYTLGTSLVIGLILVPVMFFSAIPSSDERRCDQRDRFLNREWSGQVIKTYRDSQNHNSRTIELKSANQTSRNSDFNWSKTSDFEYLQAGDSLLKRRGDSFVILVRGNEIRELVFDFGCGE